MQQVKLEYMATSGSPWIVVLPDDRRIEFATWRSARAFCSRKGFVPLISKTIASWGCTLP